MEVYISAILRKLSDIFHLNTKSSPESGECNLVLHADNKAPWRVVVLVKPFVSFSVATVFFFITYAFFWYNILYIPVELKQSLLSILDNVLVWQHFHFCWLMQLYIWECLFRKMDFQPYFPWLVGVALAVIGMWLGATRPPWKTWLLWWTEGGEHRAILP